MLYDAYKENLQMVLEDVAGLVDRLPGKVIVTSDHGELLGENGLYGHPVWSDDLALREVSWLKVEKRSGQGGGRWKRKWERK